ncbi:hypothetical protein N7U49_48805 (plasmid) [Streptomyces sp. AD2-2]|nr:hypothetical protein N7U49_48805 [Streptomyces sp. AD2-2]
MFDCEAVLRTAFTATQPPQLIVHGRVTPDITRRTAPAGGWSVFLEEDRLRGFDLRCPGALRLTLLERDPAPPPGTAPPARIVLTYHRALLDTWSAHLLLRTFYRAYLAGGTLPGGERRPDLRDYTAWIAAQDPGPARALWARWTPPAPPPPGRAAPPAPPAAAEWAAPGCAWTLRKPFASPAGPAPGASRRAVCCRPSGRC